MIQRYKTTGIGEDNRKKKSASLESLTPIDAANIAFILPISSLRTPVHQCL